MRAAAVLLLISASLPAATSGPELSGLEAPQVTVDEDGAWVLPAGFVIRHGEALLLGDAARFDRARGVGYARGNVVLVRDGVRIEAARLGWRGADVGAASGEAWDVHAELEHDGRTFRLHADHVRFGPERIEFSATRGDFGHGGALGVATGGVTVHLRPTPAADRQGIARRVEAVEVRNLRLSAAGVPFAYLPWAYRDFTLDYPWTRVRGGRTLRQGAYGRYWIGTPLPEFSGWRTDVTGRVDAYSQTGEAGGLAAGWRHPRWGEGDALWYAMPNEQLTAPPDDRDEAGERSSSVTDLSHRAAWGGLGASARWVSVPGNDPWPGSPPAWERPGDRFRSDYLREELEERPYARRGVAAAATGALGTLVVDTERRIHPDDPALERLAGMQGVLPRTTLFGPLAVGGDAWIEHLRRTAPGDARSATRLTGQGGLIASRFIGAVGLDAGAGWRALGYADGERAGVDIDDAWAWQPVATATARLRLVHEGAQYTHRLVPRLGVELLGEAAGDDLPDYDFGDPRDTLEFDRQYLRVGADTALVGPDLAGARASLLTANLDTRWALRDEDRVLGDDVGSGPLVDAAVVAEGRPVGWLGLRADAAYDFRSDAWTRLDAETRVRLHRSTALRYIGTLVPVDASWQHRPGVVLAAERYRADLGVVLRPGGEPIDTWSVGLARFAVDGVWTFGYEFVRNEDGGVYDRRLSLGFTLGGGSPSVDVEPSGSELVFGAR